MIFRDKIVQPRNKEEFSALTMGAFQHQYLHNSVYRAYADALHRTPSNVGTPEEIPFLPIHFFKTHRIIIDGCEPRKVFLSSGTTGMERSRHYVANMELYISSLTEGFRYFYGDPDDYRIFALTPAPEKAPESSLVFMLQTLMGEWNGFLPPEELRTALRSSVHDTKRTILIGTTFALLDFIEQESLHFPGLIVVETGGMKGRRREIVRQEVHQQLASGFGVPEIHSEYGMAELLSQAWSKGGGHFRCPPWMQVIIRDVTDPLSVAKDGDTGGINIIDLANHFSCPFIATQDLGKVNDDGTFEVLGRFDHSDVRGCSLMNSEG